MYKLVSEYGNEIINTDRKRKRDRLINLGYREVTEKKPPKTKTEGKKNGKENKAKSERDS